MPRPRNDLSAGAGTAQSASGWRSGFACSCTLNKNRETCLFQKTVMAFSGGLKRLERRFVSSATAVIRLAASIMWERGAVQAEFVQVTQRECVQARTSEQSLPIPVPPVNQDIAEVVQALPPRARSKTNRGAESEYPEIGRENRRSTCIDQRRAS